MLNSVALVGRLTKDPELRYTANGTAVANFTIACNRPFKTDGKQEADFINCVVWRKPAENLANYMKKGNLIGLEGRIQTRSYDGQDGKRVYVTEVVADSVQFLESKQFFESKNQGKKTNQQEQINAYNEELNNVAEMEPVDINDDDLPF